MLAFVLVIIAFAFRFLPHLFNMTPVAAALLFFGANQPRQRAWIPFAAMVLSDVLLNLRYHYALDWQMLPTFGYYAAVLLLGGLLRDSQKPLAITGAALGSSLGFFLISNGAVWAFGTMYPHNFAGLLESYAAGIPFYKGTFAGDLLFTAVFFGVGYAIKAARSNQAAGHIAA